MRIFIYFFLLSIGFFIYSKANNKLKNNGEHREHRGILNVQKKDLRIKRFFLFAIRVVFIIVVILFLIKLSIRFDILIKGGFLVVFLFLIFKFFTKLTLHFVDYFSSFLGFFKKYFLVSMVFGVGFLVFEYLSIDFLAKVSVSFLKVIFKATNNLTDFVKFILDGVQGRGESYFNGFLYNEIYGFRCEEKVSDIVPIAQSDRVGLNECKSVSDANSQ